MPAKSSAVEWPAVAPAVDKGSLLMEWEAAEKALTRAKEAELALRNQVVDAFYPAHKDEGTENVALGNGYKLKAVFKLNRTLDNDKVKSALEEIERVDAEGKFVAERIITWKPALDKKEYDNCSLKYRRFIDQVLTEKPGAPSLEIVEPKSKK